PTRVKTTVHPLVWTQNHTNAKICNRIPNTNAVDGGTVPAGMGRFTVRSIIASVSRSYHMLTAAAPPAAADNPITITNRDQGSRKAPRATIAPHRAVNTNRAVIRGFNSSTYALTICVSGGLSDRADKFAILTIPFY